MSNQMSNIKSKTIEVSIVAPHTKCLDGRSQNLVDVIDRLGCILQARNEALTDAVVGNALRGISEFSEGLNAIASAIDNLADAIRETSAGKS